MCTLLHTDLLNFICRRQILNLYYKSSAKSVKSASNTLIQIRSILFTEVNPEFILTL